MTAAASSHGAGRWIVVVALLALGLWLILGRARWARDVYTPPLSYLGRAGPLIVAALGALLILVAIWAAVAG